MFEISGKRQNAILKVPWGIVFLLLRNQNPEQKKFYRSQPSFFSHSSEMPPWFKGNHQEKVFAFKKNFFFKHRQTFLVLFSPSSSFSRIPSKKDYSPFRNKIFQLSEFSANPKNKSLKKGLISKKFFNFPRINFVRPKKILFKSREKSLFYFFNSFFSISPIPKKTFPEKILFWNGLGQPHGLHGGGGGSWELIFVNFRWKKPTTLRVAILRNFLGRKIPPLWELPAFTQAQLPPGRR